MKKQCKSFNKFHLVIRERCASREQLQNTQVYWRRIQNSLFSCFLFCYEKVQTKHTQRDRLYMFKLDLETYWRRIQNSLFSLVFFSLLDQIYISLHLFREIFNELCVESRKGGIVTKLSGKEFGIYKISRAENQPIHLQLVTLSANISIQKQLIFPRSYRDLGV